MTTSERFNNVQQQSPGGGAEGVSPPSELVQPTTHTKEMKSGIALQIPLLNRIPGISKFFPGSKEPRGLDEETRRRYIADIAENQRKILNSQLPTVDDEARIVTTLAD